MSEEYGKQQTGKNGVSIRRIYMLLIAVVCILTVITIASTYSTHRSYTRMQEATRRFIEARENADNMQNASDYLTDQVRSFVITGNRKNAENFFTEVNVTRRREMALENLGRYFGENEAYQALRNALDSSNELVSTERYAIRVALEAYGYNVADFPQELQETKLQDADASLDAVGKLALATRLVFGESYQAQKTVIYEETARCLDILISQSEEGQEESAQRMDVMLKVRTALLVVILAAFFVLVFCSYFLLIKPLNNANTHIRRQEELPLTGAEEVRFLAETYNYIFRETRRDKEQLSYEATHDSLTGLYNRGVFERQRRELDTADIAMVLADVDKFKQVNDTYGHDVGDRILKKVSFLLKKSFRSEDYVCRIGGDEFAVIMVHSDSSLRELVRDKMEKVNAQLAKPEDGLPGISLSIGVAFGDRENPTEDIFKDADTIQYTVKKSGGRNVAFY